MNFKIEVPISDQLLKEAVGDPDLQEYILNRVTKLARRELENAMLLKSAADLPDWIERPRDVPPFTKEAVDDIYQHKGGDAK